MEINGYTLVNKDKVERALKGSPNSQGVFIGGVQKADGSYGEAEFIAEYDRIGGLITKGGDKVKTGSFYDFAAKKPREEPKVVFLFRVNNQEVEVEDGEVLPGIVKAAKVLKEESDAPKKGRPKKNG